MSPKPSKKLTDEEKITQYPVTVIDSPQDLDKPSRDTNFAHESAKLLIDIVRQNNWAKKLGGQSEHLQFEAWQTVGKYYGYTVQTYDPQPVDIDGIKGFHAKAKVINEVTGIEVGGAEAYCMRDEGNWSKKPTFQLASMAQTRAGSKALRQILGFVVALAGYNPTPAEEMTDVQNFQHTTNSNAATPQYSTGMTEPQNRFIHKLLTQKGKSDEELHEVIEKLFGKKSLTELTKDEASKVIERLVALEDVVDNPYGDGPYA